MTIPQSKTTIQDGALGLTPSNPDRIQAKVCVCAGGPLNTPTQVGSIQQLKTTFIGGPGVEAAAHVLAVAGGPIIICRAAASNAGAAGAVTKVGTGLSVLTLTGTPLDGYEAIVKIVVGGANPASGAIVFIYSLDGGNSWSPKYALPTSGVFPISGSGISLNFSAATLVAGDVYSFNCTAPSSTLGDITTALDALLASQTGFFLVHIVGIPADLAASTALFGALDTKMAEAENSFRYTFAVMELPDDTDANITTAYASLASLRVAVCAGFERLSSSATQGASYKRPLAWSATGRASQVPPSQDVGDVGLGGLTGVTALYRNEEATPGLYDLNFTVGRTYSGQRGFFITGGRIFAAPTSDFQTWTARRVMDIASRVIRAGTLPLVNSRVRVDKDTGFILGQDADRIESRLETMLRDALGADSSNIQVAVARDENILSTKTLSVGYRIIPLVTLEQIANTVGFQNPALERV
jgi:hypothetical protein